MAEPAELVIRRVFLEELTAETRAEQSVNPTTLCASPYQPTLRTAERCGVHPYRVTQVMGHRQGMPLLHDLKSVG